MKRLAIGALGLLLLAYGAKILVPLLGSNHPVSLAKWLIATVAVHDGLIAPATILVGWLLTVAIPPRARRYAQGFLLTSALVVAVTLPLIHRRGSAPRAWPCSSRTTACTCSGSCWRSAR